MSKTEPKVSAATKGSAEPERPPLRDPTPSEQTAIDKAVDYCRSRTPPLAYDVEAVDGKDISIRIPHSATGGFLALQRATFGTVSAEFASRAGGQVGDIVRSRGQTMPDPDALNAGIAAIAAVEPQNEVEAMLAVQMLGAHTLAMDMLSRAKQATTTDHLERYGTLATKMLRTYTTQLETLSKLRRGGSQKVTVEHVHVYQGGQAIVGNVAHGGGERIANGHQPHALTGAAALALSTGPEMLRADPERDAVPIASRERQEPMPDARRRRRQRSAKG